MWGELRQKQATLTICAGCPVALRKLGLVSRHVALFLALVLIKSWPLPGSHRTGNGSRSDLSALGKVTVRT